jgi:hypothetical protein
MDDPFVLNGFGIGTRWSAAHTHHESAAVALHIVQRVTY